jgi:3'(2'), 5'-bisphosphate nucleotidase
MLERDALLDGLVETALEAGAVIWRHFQAGFEVITKADDSPVTAADRDAEAVILEALARLDPLTPVVAEEEAAAGRTPQVGARYYLVDPLDGTREFVRRGNDFTVNIGLVEGDRSTLGVIYAPARDDLFVGDVTRGLAWRARCVPGGVAGPRTAMRVRPPGAALAALASRSHADPATNRYLDGLPIGDRLGIGSSLKFCLLAAGEADLYPRTGPTMEWDTAAGQAILEAAGGETFGPEGEPFRYGKPGFRNGAFVATAGFAAPPIAPFLRDV